MARAGDDGDRSDKRQRNKILQKRVNDEEFDGFKQRAREAGFDDYRDYLTALIFGKEALERSDRTSLIQAIGQLGKHGSNLNQLAKAANSGKIKSLKIDDMQQIKDARQAVNDVSKELREALR